jgi:hypothetical protein
MNKNVKLTNRHLKTVAYTKGGKIVKRVRTTVTTETPVSKAGGLNQEIAFEDSDRPRVMDIKDVDYTVVNLDLHPDQADSPDMQDIDAADEAQDAADARKDAVSSIADALRTAADALGKL